MDGGDQNIVTTSHSVSSMIDDQEAYAKPSEKVDDLNKTVFKPSSTTHEESSNPVEWVRETPAQSEQPEQLVQSLQAEQFVQPEQPAQPEQSIKPEQLVQPEQPVQPELSVQPEQLEGIIAVTSLQASEASESNHYVMSSNESSPDETEDPRTLHCQEEKGSATLMNGSVWDATLNETLQSSALDDSVSEHGEPQTREPLEPHTLASSQWLDVLGNGQLLKKVIKPGDGPSTRPTMQCGVKLRVKGFLESGQTFSYPHSFRFIVGDGDVIQAWDLAASLMEKREVALVKSDPRFAYGETGREPDVPPNATVTFELELVEVTSPVDYSIVTESELLSLVNAKRTRGNDLFQRNEYERAVNSYSKGCTMLENYLKEQNLEANDAVKGMQVRCWNNLAAAALKVEQHQEVLKACENVLKYEPNNVKALFRCGKVQGLMGNYDAAVEALQKTSLLSPNEKAIQAELQRVIRKRDKSKEDEKALYRRMMVGGETKQPVKTLPLKVSSASDGWGPLPYLVAAASIAAVGIGLAYFFFQRH